MHNKHQVERSTQVNLKYGPHKGICGDVILGNREAVMKSTEKSITWNKGSTQVNRLVYNCLIIVIVTVEFSNEIRSPRGMHDTSKSKLQVAE
jgi:hypothetical protein